MNKQDRIIPFLKKEGVPFILVGTNYNGDVLQIDSNQQDGCEKLMLHEIQSGCRKIALLAGNRSHLVDIMRYEGYKKAIEETQFDTDKSFVFWNAPKNISAAVQSALDVHADCIVCMDDTICGGVLDCLSDGHIHIPDDVQVVSFYDSTVLSSGQIPVTALHVDSLELCKRAGNLLIDEIEGRSPARRNVAEYSIIYRDSSR